MIRLTMTAVALAVLAGAALAKLPPPDEAAKAKAAEAAAKSAWQGKVDAFQLCKAQDRVAARYKSSHPERKAATAAPAAAGASATAAAASAAKPAPMPTPTAATASQGGSTPVAAASPNPPAVPACADPGPFAYVPPEQKPLESSGAHSPAATASGAPSVRVESGAMTSGKTGAAPKK